MKSITIANDSFFSSILQLLKEGKDVKIKVAGKSMEPFIKDGEHVILSPARLEDVQMGDVVLGCFNRNYVFHRVIWKKYDCVFLAGDNNLRQIEVIKKELIYAVGWKLFTKRNTINLRKINTRYKGIVWFLLRPVRRLYLKMRMN